MQSTYCDNQKQIIRALVDGVYQTQKLRIQSGNRIVAILNIQMGQEPSKPQTDMDSETKKLIDRLRKEYKLITDAYTDKKFGLFDSGKTNIMKSKKKDAEVTEEVKVITIAKNAGIKKVIDAMSKNDKSGVNIIKDEQLYNLIGTYVDLQDNEEKQLKLLEKYVVAHPMWDKFFKDVKGCGILMAAVCLAYIDISKARHVSSLWKYTGLDVVPVVVDGQVQLNKDGTVLGEGKSNKKSMMVEQTYTDKEGNVKTKLGIGYNPTLKTKLVGVLGDCMIKAGLRTLKDEKGDPILDSNGNKRQVANSKYTQCYIDYMNRLHMREETKDYTKMRKHRMAVRYMIKQFLRDMWVEWRTLEGMSVSQPYEVAKLGHKPHKYNEYQVKHSA